MRNNKKNNLCGGFTKIISQHLFTETHCSNSTKNMVTPLHRYIKLNKKRTGRQDTAIKKPAKEVNGKLKITIEASEKEIAALVLALQEQQFEKYLKEKIFKKNPEDAF